MVNRTTFTLQLTERCDLACKYCYVRERGGRKKPEPDDCTPQLCEAFVDFTLRESGGDTKIAFFGGEPLLRPDLIEHTVRYGKNQAREAGKSMGFHIVTNGTLLDDALGDFIAKENIGLEVSLDGPEKVHDSNRPYPDGSGSFRTVHENLLRFKRRHPDHEVQIFSVITETESLPWLRELLKELNTESFTFNPVHLSLEKEKALGYDLPGITQRALKKRVALHREKFLGGESFFDEGINCQMSFFLNGKATRGCDVGINTTIATQSGKLYPCPLFIGHEDQVIGDIFHGFYHEKTRPYIERTVERIEACRDCSIKHFCGGGCAFSAYQRNGSIYSPFKRSCTVAKRYAEELQKSIVTLASKRPEAFRIAAGLKTKGTTPPSPPSPPAKQKARTPESFVIRLTGECNLSCTYCYDKKPSAMNGRLDSKTAKSIANYIIAGPSEKPVVSLFGGEPLLNWETGRYLVEAIAKESEKKNKKPYFHITTNGTLITADIAKTLARHDFAVQISIDGTKVRHDHNRRFKDGSGSYDAVLRGAERIRRINPGAKIDAQVVLTPGNTDMVGIARELTARGFRRINFLKCTWADRSGVKWSKGDVKKLMGARERFFPFFLNAAVEGNAEIDMNLAALVASEPGGTEGLCECGSAEVYIDTKGDIYPCPQVYSPGQYVLGNCSSKDPQEAMGIKPEAKEAEEDCSGCWAYSRCRGGCAVLCQRCPLTGSTLAGEDKKLWCDLMRAEFARAMIAHRILKSCHPGSLKALKSIFAG